MTLERRLGAVLAALVFVGALSAGEAFSQQTEPPVELLFTPAADAANGVDVADGDRSGLEIPVEVGEPPAGEESYRAIFQPIFWIAWSDHGFRKGAGGTFFDLESAFGADTVRPQLPLHFLLRTASQEIRGTFLWWRRDGVRLLSGGNTIDFDGLTYSSERVSADLGVYAFGLDFLQRVAGSDLGRYEFYLTAGGDLLITDLKLSGTVLGSGQLREVVPILTVGLGLRFFIREGVSFSATSSALSYAQLLQLDNTFFDVEDTYRNIEVSFRWDRSARFSWGAGWKHYEVGFADDTLSAHHRLTGPSVWMSVRF
jgi:hypothetical protein